MKFELPIIKNRYDTEIFLIQCEHSAFLLLDSSGWCDECDDWIEGKDIGDLTVYLHEDGYVKVIGSGYVDFT